LSVGICTWVFGDRSLDRVAEDVRRIGFDAVEVVADPQRVDAARARRTLAAHGLNVVSMTPCEADPAHPDPRTRSEAVDRYRRMLDLAASIGSPLLGFHGSVGRIRPLSSQHEEERLLLESGMAVADYAAAVGVHLAVEVLNRYESHLLNRCEQALDFVRQIDRAGVGILLDTYHMNIEEADPAVAVRAAGRALHLVHVADSNRRAIGRGHLDFGKLFGELDALDYRGPIAVETVAPTPDPFDAAGKDEEYALAMDEAAETLRWLRSEGRC